MPESITVWAPAKLNLTLDVLGRRPDGYHELLSVMQTLELADRLELSLIPEGTEVLGGPNLPRPEDNLVYRAIEVLREKTGFRGGLRVHLEKHIPVAAGLGGGSADAAAALSAANLLLGLGLTPHQLVGLAVRLGSDVPFCLVGGTVLVGGRGEKLSLLPSAPSMWLVLARPALELSTAKVYQAWDQLGELRPPSTYRLVAALHQGWSEGVVAALSNQLEPVTLRLCPKVAALKEKLLTWGAGKVWLCGSGPTLAALVDSRAQGEELADRARAEGYQTWLTRTRV
ncbi:MAG: 4-(cytidine 5'-diphospho)-2-C-methyl-D-erythritol kinase [Moorellales bacterium]